MRRISSLLFTLLIIVAVGAFVTCIPNEDGEYIWNPFDYARITEVDYKAIVNDDENSNGKIIVTERLTFDVHSAFESNPFWELWRDLPETYIDGVKTEYQVHSVKQIFENGEALIYQESPKLYWEDYDYTSSWNGYGPNKWYHSKGPYNEDLRQYECLLFYVDGIYRDTVTYEIEYEMTNAALRYRDASELYLSMYSDDTVKYLTSFKGQILIPQDKMPREGNYYANTYGTNTHTFPFTESDSLNPGYHTFSFALDASDLQFKSYNEYIEFALVSYGEDKHKFTQNASINQYYNEDVLAELEAEQAEYNAIPTQRENAKKLVLTISIGSTFLVLFLAFFLVRNSKKKNVFYQTTMDIDYFRDIPSPLDPTFVTDFVFCKRHSTQSINNAYAATLLSLVYKGYIALQPIDSNKKSSFKNMKIVILYQPSLLEPMAQSILLPPTEDSVVKEVKALTPIEEQFFRLILRYVKNDEVTLYTLQQKAFRDYQYTTSFMKNIQTAIISMGITKGYYQKAAYKKPKEQIKAWAKVYVIVGILSLTIGNIISYASPLDFAYGSFSILGIGCLIGALYLYLRSKKLVLLTQLGEDEYSKWYGLYHFLNSETLLHEKTTLDIVLWEQYLIYATAFGISKKVIKALQLRCPDINTSPILSNPFYSTRSFRTSSRTFIKTTRHASFASRRGSWHSGFGGGGRGGGGGGGGH